MTPAEERQAIFKALREYSERYNAGYYVLILTPPEGKEFRFPGSYDIAKHFSEENDLGPTMHSFFLKENQERIDAIGKERQS